MAYPAAARIARENIFCAVVDEAVRSIPLLSNGDIPNKPVRSCGMVNITKAFGGRDSSGSW